MSYIHQQKPQRRSLSASFRKYQESSFADCLNISRDMALGCYDFAEPKVAAMPRLPLPAKCGVPGAASRSSSLAHCVSVPPEKTCMKRGTKEARKQRQGEVERSRSHSCSSSRSRSRSRSQSQSSTSSETHDSELFTTAGGTFGVATPCENEDTRNESKQSQGLLQRQLRRLSSISFGASLIQKPGGSEDLNSLHSRQSSHSNNILLLEEPSRGRKRWTRGRSPTRRCNSMNAEPNRLQLQQQQKQQYRQEQAQEYARRTQSASPRLVSFDQGDSTSFTESRDRQLLQLRKGTFRQSGLEINEQNASKGEPLSSPRSEIPSGPSGDQQVAVDANSKHKLQLQRQPQSVCDVISVWSPTGSQGQDTILVRNGGKRGDNIDHNNNKCQEGFLTPSRKEAVQKGVDGEPFLESSININKKNDDSDFPASIPRQEISPVSLAAPLGRSTPNQVAPSLVNHMHQGNDVSIFVGTGLHQKVYSYNSHVLLYISDYFSQIMQPMQDCDTTTTSTRNTTNNKTKWRIDFTHKRVEEWEMFYPFLAPPVKQTVSVDIFNLPVLLPWFHEFQLPLLLHQCDAMLSSIIFRPVNKAQTSDLQDVLLLLYIGLSCDLPRSQDLGIQTMQTYLKEAPQLFLKHTIIQRLIILLQCFPQFQQVMWFSSIQNYLPLDLDLCCDTDSMDSRDALLQNPLFPFLLREGLIKAKSRLRTKTYLQHKKKLRTGTAATGSTTTNTTTASSPSCLDQQEHVFSEEFDLNGIHRDAHSISPTETFLEELSGITPSDPVSAASPKVTSPACQKETNNFLEMTVTLGDQFWGPGWANEQSLTEEHRLQDRRQWLEDTVKSLKDHAAEQDRKHRSIQRGAQLIFPKIEEAVQPIQPPVQPSMPPNLVERPVHLQHEQDSHSIPPRTSSRPKQPALMTSSGGVRPSPSLLLPSPPPAAAAAPAGTSRSRTVATVKKNAEVGRISVQSPVVTTSTHSSRQTFAC